ncbi:hypothetical protein Tco_0249131, partial [Tanacetum coccineum]
MIPAATSLLTSSLIAMFLSTAWPLFFCLTGWQPSHTFSLCSATFLGTPVSSVRLEPTITVCSGYSGLIATLTLSSLTLLTGRGRSSGLETIAHSIGMTLLLLIVSVPHMTGNFIIPCVVDGTACIFRNAGLPMIPLCGDVNLTTIKSIHADVECSP